MISAGPVICGPLQAIPGQAAARVTIRPMPSGADPPVPPTRASRVGPSRSGQASRPGGRPGGPWPALAGLFGPTAQRSPSQPRPARRPSVGARPAAHRRPHARSGRLSRAPARRLDPAAAGVRQPAPRRHRRRDARPFTSGPAWRRSRTGPGRSRPARHLEPDRRCGPGRARQGAGLRPDPVEHAQGGPGADPCGDRDRARRSHARAGAQPGRLCDRGRHHRPGWLDPAFDRTTSSVPGSRPAARAARRRQPALDPGGPSQQLGHPRRSRPARSPSTWATRPSWTGPPRSFRGWLGDRAATPASPGATEVAVRPGGAGRDQPRRLPASRPFDRWRAARRSAALRRVPLAPPKENYVWEASREPRSRPSC